VRKLAAASIAAIVAACTQGAQEPAPGSMDRARHGPPVALYSNGGFESGNLSSWTVSTNTNPGITYPPASISDLRLGAGGTARSYARTGATPESQIPAGMSASSTLRYPKYGTYSGVINETGANRNVNSMFQQMATTAADVDPADSLIHVRFVVAPVLQSPGHGTTQQPYYYVQVDNVTQGTTLFSRFNYVNENGVPWQSDSGGAILYTGWQVVDVPGTAGSIAIGDTVEVRVIAAGCSLGGHWGEAYVDAFGAFLPGLSIAAHAPQRANAGSNLTTSYAVTNSGSSTATSVTVVAPVPAQTTFVSLTTPPGAVCTTPAVGATGNVTCVFGTMNPSSTLSFTLVTAISAAASGTIPNGSYTVSSTGNSALLGPLVTTAVTSAVTYADLSVTMNDGTGGVAWGEAIQYTMVVSNAGPATATDATVVDTLPAQLTGATWTCSSASGTCGAASGSGSINTTVTLPSGASATYVLSASIVAGSGTSRVTNVVNVATAGVTDPDTTNNRAADTDDIGIVVTVTVQKDATGTGLGTVVSSPTAISCGPACISASAQFATGNLVTLTATADPGDTFVGWSGACSGVATTCNLNPAANVTATAKFMLQSFTISGSAPAGNGNVSCTSPVLHNQSSTCTIAPSSGYKLSQLTDNGSDVTALVVSNAYTISSVGANHTVAASFLKDYGTACSGAGECTGGICTDGVCCTAACAGQCQACDVPGSVGACTTVTSGAPHGTRPACGTDGSACGGTCDGSSATACGYPGASTQCRAASCAAGTAVPAGSCNGTGTCPSAASTQCTPYVCGPGACLTSCATDSDCISGDYCDGTGACVPKKADGLSCGGSNQCGSGSCADGVCCNQACGGQCQACDLPGQLGQCVAVSGAPHGARTACSGSGTCGGSCDGTNAAACAYPTVQCRGASCTAGTATAAGSCDGAGSCPAVVTTTCNPYVCGATACKTSCTADADCISGDYCNVAGACVSKKADGYACGAANECANGSCADGVCCARACNGQCEACDVPGSVGQCVAVSGPPHGARTACAGSGTCGGACDGANAAACAYPSSSTSCRNASCSGGTATAAATCDGAGACPPAVTAQCDPYLCGGNACKTSCLADSDCIAADRCDATGVCVPKTVVGQACTASNQCASGFCIDGYCCDQGCAGQCQACDLAGSEGTCTAVSGNPRGARIACRGSSTACGGTCDGVATAVCAYPGATLSCRGGSCSAGTATLAAGCDGAGLCPAPQTQPCAPYVCGATACVGNCTRDADCVAGDWCSAGVCVAQLPDAQACGGSNQCASGSCVDGVCCDQACGGQCQACDVPGSVGVCVAVGGVPHSARPACATDGSACGGSCDGVRGLACAYPTASCRGASCSAGVATLAASCDGAGHCPVQQTQPCNPYVCGATACRGDCMLDSDCAGGNFCAAGVCTPQLVAGAGCGGANQCASGFCADGVCCDQACSGQCQACDVLGSAGVCVAVLGAPHGIRLACASDGMACGGLCDGANGVACAYPTAQCRGASCSAGVATLAAACDGAGRCPAPQAQACAPYVCGPTACLGNCASNADCAGGDWCSAGVCVAQLANGTGCGGAVQCASGNCVDGVCCDAACTGQCEACNVSGSAGLCTVVIGDPRAGRPACATDGSACAGTCNGSSRTACAYPPADSQCRAASCSNGVASAATTCDGAGHCPAAQQASCNAYVCGASACKTSCSADADCQDAGFCVAGLCHSRNDPAVWMVAGGGGCAEGGPATWPLVLLVLAFALRRRRMAALAVALAATGAGAQSASFAVDHFQPGGGAFDVLGVWSPETAANFDWRGSVYTSYARDPLRLVALEHPDQVQLLRGQSMLHLGGSVGFLDRFELGAVLPIAVAQASNGAPMLGGAVSGPVASGGMGDLRVLPKARLLSVGGFLLGAAAPFTLPIGRQEAYLGAGAPTLTPTVLAELQDVLPVRLLANVGVAVRRGRSLGNLKVSSAFTYGLGAELPFALRGQPLAALATLSGEADLQRGGAVERPLELMGAIRWSGLRGLDVLAGGGPGLTAGYGTPAYRLFFALSFSPQLLGTRRTTPLVPTFAAEPPPPAPTLTVVARDPPMLFSRTLELARIEEDHVELLAPVLFARARDVLLPQSRAVLDAAVSVLEKHPELSLVRIEGHTDGHGKTDYNLGLSKRRAKAVRLYLMKHGIGADRLESEGFGSSRPIASNDGAEGRARNRRVEMLIVRREAVARLPGAAE